MLLPRLSMLRQKRDKEVFNIDLMFMYIMREPNRCIGIGNAGAASTCANLQRFSRVRSTHMY